MSMRYPWIVVNYRPIGDSIRKSYFELRTIVHYAETYDEAQRAFECLNLEMRGSGLGYLIVEEQQ